MKLVALSPCEAVCDKGVPADVQAALCQHHPFFDSETEVDPSKHPLKLLVPMWAPGWSYMSEYGLIVWFCELCICRTDLQMTMLDNAWLLSLFGNCLRGLSSCGSNPSCGL